MSRKPLFSLALDYVESAFFICNVKHISIKKHKEMDFMGAFLYSLDDK